MGGFVTRPSHKRPKNPKMSEKTKSDSAEGSSSSASSASSTLKIPKLAPATSKELKDALNSLSEGIEVQFSALSTELKELRQLVEAIQRQPAAVPANFFVGAPSKLD
jgi:hypothetical protein